MFDDRTVSFFEVQTLLLVESFCYKSSLVAFDIVIGPSFHLKYTLGSNNIVTAMIWNKRPHVVAKEG